MMILHTYNSDQPYHQYQIQQERGGSPPLSQTQSFLRSNTFLLYRVVQLLAPVHLGSEFAVHSLLAVVLHHQ